MGSGSSLARIRDGNCRSMDGMSDWFYLVESLSIANTIELEELNFSRNVCWS